MVKILCVADEVDRIVYSNGIKDRYGDVNFVISAGDLQMSYLGFIVSMLNKRLYFVFGNHHLEHYTRFKRPSLEENSGEVSSIGRNFFGSTFIGDKVMRDKRTGLLLAGLGGSLMYNRGENQFTDLHMYLKIVKMIPRLLINRIFYRRWIDILVTHAPPLGIGDREDRCHQGFKAFLWFMRKFKPMYLLHGHIHLWDLNEQRERVYEDTTVINIYGRYVLEITDDELRAKGIGREKKYVTD